MGPVEFAINQTKELKTLNDLLNNYHRLYNKTVDPKRKRYLRYASYLIVGKVNRILLGLPKIDDRVKEQSEAELGVIFNES